jgi:hypothetical protein
MNFYGILFLSFFSLESILFSIFIETSIDLYNYLSDLHYLFHVQWNSFIIQIQIQLFSSIVVLYWTPHSHLFVGKCRNLYLVKHWNMLIEIWFRSSWCFQWFLSFLSFIYVQKIWRSITWSDQSSE